MKILLVEDNAESRRHLARLLAQRGHAVVDCATAEEAERAIAATKFPFFILDWMLPGKSGLDLCRQLRAQPDGDEMFILLVTARGDDEDLEQALAGGANDYLTKPLDPRRLAVRLSVAERQIRELQERNEARRALRETAQRMTDILEKTTDGFFALDRDWNFTYLNPTAERALGFARDELVRQNLWETFPTLAGSIFEKNYRTAMREQRAVKFEARVAGGASWLEVHAYPSDGGVSVFFRDISDRRRAEEERLTTSKLESLGTLAGGIAHDLNNILTIISGNIGLAQLEAPTHSATLFAHLNKAGEAAQSAARLSNQLLTFSKGGAPLKKVGSLADLLRRATEFSFHGSNMRAALEMEEPLALVEMDARQIEQVMNALLMNAREAMPGSGVVFVQARNFLLQEKSAIPLAPGRYSKVSITDRGEGIAAKNASRIFDPYFTTKPEASGLGLAIAYSIIKKHGGFLHLEKNSPGGATFSFYLPVVEQSASSEIAPPPPNEIDFRPEHPRILVMDDEPAVRELTGLLLASMDYEVTEAAKGEEALQFYEAALQEGKKYQVVILDATIRDGMGGVETITRLRRRDPQVRAIICSGYSDAAATAKFLSYGFCCALPKPFTRRELGAAVNAALGGKRA